MKASHILHLSSNTRIMQFVNRTCTKNTKSRYWNITPGLVIPSEEMTASFDVDISLNKTEDVWYDDAYIKDYTGVVNLTAGEHKAVLKAILTMQKNIGKSRRHIPLV